MSDGRDSALPERPGPRKKKSPAPGASTFRPAPGAGSDSGPSPIGPRKSAKATSSAPGGSSKGAAPVRGKPGYFERVVFGKVTAGQLSALCRQLASYLGSGVDLLRSLQALQDQFAATALGPILGRIQLRIRGGDSLSEAFADEPAAFDTYFLSMMRVAEARGALPETLKGLAAYYESRQRLLRQARSALIYPVIVVVAALAVMWLVTVFVLPMLIDMLRDMTRGGAANLPLPTRMLMGLSTFMQWVGWWALPLGAVATVFLLNRAYRTPPGKALIDRVAMALPVLGPLLRQIDTARMARSLAALLEAGVGYPESFALTADILRLQPLRQAMTWASHEVVEGREVAAVLEDSGLFPQDLLAVVETGESTGKLPESLDHLADDYEDRIAHTVKNLGQLLQPVIYIVLGSMVLFLALGFVMAYAQVIQNLAGGL